MATTIKLSDREVTAIASKLRTKAVQERNSKVSAASKAKTAEAKKILETITALPAKIKDAYVVSSLRNGSAGVPQIAALLVDIPEVPESRAFENDVILAAKDCPTMAKFYSKIGL